MKHPALKTLVWITGLLVGLAVIFSACQKEDPQPEPDPIEEPDLYIDRSGYEGDYRVSHNYYVYYSDGGIYDTTYVFQNLSVVADLNTDRDVLIELNPNRAATRFTVDEDGNLFFNEVNKGEFTNLGYHISFSSGPIGLGILGSGDIYDGRKL